MSYLVKRLRFQRVRAQLHIKWQQLPRIDVDERWSSELLDDELVVRNPKSRLAAGQSPSPMETLIVFVPRGTEIILDDVKGPVTIDPEIEGRVMGLLRGDIHEIGVMNGGSLVLEGEAEVKVGQMGMFCSVVLSGSARFDASGGTIAQLNVCTSGRASVRIRANCGVVSVVALQLSSVRLFGRMTNEPTMLKSDDAYVEVL